MGFYCERCENVYYLKISDFIKVFSMKIFWGLSLSENNEVGGYPVGGGRV